MCRRRNRRVLQGGVALLRGGAQDLRRERRQLSDGAGRQVVVYRGVILGPRQRLDSRGNFRGHHPTSRGGGRAAGGRMFQHRPGRSRGPVAV